MDLEPLEGMRHLNRTSAYGTGVIVRMGMMMMMRCRVQIGFQIGFLVEGDLVRVCLLNFFMGSC